MRQLVSLFIILVMSSGVWAQTQKTDIIPQPVQMNVHKGCFTISATTKILLNINNTQTKELAGQLQELIENASGLKLQVEAASVEKIKGNILVHINNPFNTKIGSEGYSLDVKANSVSLSANTSTGLYYGAQTIWQMLTAGNGKKLSCVEITDYPRFGWRGMHLDVSRHFFPVSFIYKYIDYIAMHKMNVFHWHLVDDQGWRIEIKKYPKLTEIGAWRADLENRDWTNRGEGALKGNESKYGGFYTQDEIKAVVAYAKKKHVTIIPEIEMPAHAMSALAAYPEYSCSGEYVPVPPGSIWPITHIYCPGKEATFHFLEDILKEVMALFPSTYIHIGGDEATKTEWEKCPLCQKRMKNENLANEHELQAYFIKRIERFLNSYGRELIGWDEILEGGLNPSATIMAWRGTKPGIKAARAGHDVVMSPLDYCYFDYYQGIPALEPKAFGGNITLKKIYGFEPVPEELTVQEAKHIIGGQANLWTEYVSTPKHAEYMIMPRMCALSEVLWSPKASRDWADFSKRMETQYRRMGKLGINYATSAFQVKVVPELLPGKHAVKIKLTTEACQPEIHYTTDGTEPCIKSEKYTGPFELAKTSTVKALVVQNGRPMTKASSSTFVIHKAIACPVEMKYPNHKDYNSTGEFALVDGIKGSINNRDGSWKGFDGKDLVATINLGENTSFSKVTIGVMQNIGAWIFYPKAIIVESSNNGVQFKQLAAAENKADVETAGAQIKNITIKKRARAKYLRVTVKNFGNCPKGHAGEGKPAWLFVDEIAVE